MSLLPHAAATAVRWRSQPTHGLTLPAGLGWAGFTKLPGGLTCPLAARCRHSYGGATITALVAEDPVWRCGIALDPW